MSDGKCGLHSYGSISQQKMDTILAELKKGGATVTGNNPWNVNLNKYGIILQGTYDQPTSTLSIIVLAKAWYVPCNKIWAEINTLIGHIQGVSEDEVALAHHELHAAGS